MGVANRLGVSFRELIDHSTECEISLENWQNKSFDTFAELQRRNRTLSAQLKQELEAANDSYMAPHLTMMTAQAKLKDYENLLARAIVAILTKKTGHNFQQESAEFTAQKASQGGSKPKFAAIDVEDIDVDLVPQTPRLGR